MIVKIFNANNTDAVALKNPDNLYRETESGGSIKLCFDISPKDEQYKLIAEEIKLEYDNIFYTIKKINERKTVSSIEAVIDLDDFKKQAYYDYYKTEYLLSDLLDDCLSGTGWVHRDSTLISRKHTVELKNCNTLDIINEASKLWGCQFSFDNKNKVITAIDTEIKQPTGVFFTDELNLLSVGFKGDSSSFITRLKCRGKKDENDNYLTFADINDGKDYVENYDYSDKVITGIWVDERYTDKQSLKDDAIERLKTLAIPVRSYECTIADLAKIDPKYNNFAVALYDIVTLIDRERKTRVNHRIVKLREYDKTPLKNVITLNSVTHTITGNIKQLDTLISNAGDIKVDGITLNEFKRDINNNSLEIQKRYTKGETDTILDTKILQSESEIMTKVSEKYSTKEDTTNEISSAVTQTKSDITFDFKNGGLSSNVVFNNEGQIIYNGGLTIFNKNNNKQFYADDNGNLVLSGTIFANSGKIGGWNINGFKIYAGDGKDVKTSVIQAPSSDITWVFAAGGASHDSYSDCPFRVDKYGNLYATSGNIGGWHIGTNVIYGGDTVNGKLHLWAPDSTNGWVMATYIEEGGKLTTPFVLTKQGHLTATKADIKGTITATSGSFNGTITAQNGEIGGWSINTNYLQGTWGSNYVKIKVPDDTSDTTFLDVKYNGTFPFVVDKYGHLTATDANITGTITATEGKIGNWEISDISYMGGTCLFAKNGNYSAGISSRWLHGGSSEYYGYVEMVNVVKSARDWANLNSSESDKNVKNSITTFESEYEKLFDNLIPCRYKYNHGTSDRFHTGFIAQEVVDAITKAGLTTSDFAGIVHLKEPNWNNCEWLLRRDEFIALNTWQIQKLKKKVIDLTEKLDKQQKEINDLKALIQ